MDTLGVWKIERYCSDNKERWDDFVRTARNATFLHLRDYMDYHSDRFRDWSLMAYKGGRLRALLPAEVMEEEDGKIVMGSHRGLTYGGWLLPTQHIDGEDVMALFDSWIAYCEENNIREIDYKPVPHIYHRMPSQEDIYALWRYGAKMKSFNLSSTIDLQNNPGFNSQQRRNMAKFLKNHPDAEYYMLESEEEISEFYDMLSQCLAERHESAPVHSRQELQMLAHTFPQNIRISGVRVGGRLAAGVCQYLTDEVAHSQYIATTSEGRNSGALAWLFSRLIEEAIGHYKYFDLGTSNEDGGRLLNYGLLRQKSGLGGSGIIYPRYFLAIPSE